MTLGIHDYGLFVLSAILLNLAPGQDTLYILGRSLGQGRRIGVASALGVSAGTLVHTFAAALGLSAIVAASESAFVAIKVAGAIYLLYLGIRALITPASLLDLDTTSRDGARVAFRQGLVTNVLNPKVGLFFLAFLPQFVSAGAPHAAYGFLALGLTFVATCTVWALILAAAAARVRHAFERHGRARAWLTRAMGGVFLYLGARLAFADR
ncbi:MAG: LysE family translocator [Burkholderiales bacterium]